MSAFELENGILVSVTHGMSAGCDMYLKTDGYCLTRAGNYGKSKWTSPCFKEILELFKYATETASRKFHTSPVKRCSACGALFCMDCANDFNDHYGRWHARCPACHGVPLYLKDERVFKCGSATVDGKWIGGELKDNPAVQAMDVCQMTHESAPGHEYYKIDRWVNNAAAFIKTQVAMYFLKDITDPGKKSIFETGLTVYLKHEICFTTLLAIVGSFDKVGNTQTDVERILLGKFSTYNDPNAVDTFIKYTAGAEPLL